MNRFQLYLVAASLMCGVSASAQQLSTQIRGEYADSVSIPESSRLPFTPEVPAATVQGPKYLSYSLQSLSVAVPSLFSTLEPAAIADTLVTGSHRGYARLGIMSIYNVDASAGYKILDNDLTRLSAWMQYDASAYRGHYLPDPGNGSRFVHSNAATFGSSLHQAVGRESMIDLGVDYTFHRYDVGAPAPDNLFATDARSVGRFNISSLWTQHHRALDFGVGAAYHYLHISNPLIYVPGENRIDGTAFIKGAFAGSSSAGLSATVSYGKFGGYESGYTQLYWDAPLSRSSTLLTLNPYYRLDLTNVHLDIGANINFAFNAGKCFHIAPDVKAVWIPAPIVKVYGSVSGGVRQHSLASQLEASPMLLPVAGVRPSNVPYEMTVGATIGSYHGLYANVALTYARANDWLMPIQDVTTGFASFSPLDVKGYKFHISAGYQFKDIAAIGASFEKAPKKSRHAYYMWLDRATTVASATLSVKPFTPLRIKLHWQFRSGRAVTTVTPQGAVFTGLGAISKLGASASYRVNGQWTLEGSIDNILNRSFMYPGFMPGQGITGLIGASYQF